MKNTYLTPEVDIVHLAAEEAILGSSSQTGTGADITLLGGSDFDSFFGS